MYSNQIKSFTSYTLKEKEILEFISSKYNCPTFNSAAELLDSSITLKNLVKNNFLKEKPNHQNKLFGDFTIIKQNRFLSVPSHCHDSIEIIYVLSGKAQIMIENEKRNILLEKNDVLILNSKVYHSIEYAASDDLIINFLTNKSLFKTHFLNQLPKTLPITNFFESKPDNIKKASPQLNYLHIEKDRRTEQIDIIINSILSEYMDKKLNYNSSIFCFLILLINEIARTFDTDSPQPIAPEKQNDEIDQIINYITENYNACDLLNVSKDFSFSPDYISKSIKKRTGKSFKKFIIDLRLDQSAKLLRETNLTIDGIAHEVGFNNLTFYYKKFFQRYDLSPNSYRQADVMYEGTMYLKN